MSVKEKIFSIYVSLPWYRRIEVLRIANGWTQEEAAALCGTSERVFWNWENGKFRPAKSNMLKISQLFDVPEKEIFPEKAKVS